MITWILISLGLHATLKPLPCSVIRMSIKSVHDVDKPKHRWAQEKCTDIISFAAADMADVRAGDRSIPCPVLSRLAKADPRKSDPYPNSINILCFCFFNLVHQTFWYSCIASLYNKYVYTGIYIYNIGAYTLNSIGIPISCSPYTQMKSRKKLSVQPFAHMAWPTRWSLPQSKNRPWLALLGWGHQSYWGLCIETMTSTGFLEVIHWQKPRVCYWISGPNIVLCFLDTNFSVMLVLPAHCTGAYRFLYMETRGFIIANLDC